MVLPVAIDGSGSVAVGLVPGVGALGVEDCSDVAAVRRGTVGGR